MLEESPAASPQQANVNVNVLHCTLLAASTPWPAHRSFCALVSLSTRLRRLSSPSSGLAARLGLPSILLQSCTPLHDGANSSSKQSAAPACVCPQATGPTRSAVGGLKEVPAGGLRGCRQPCCWSRPTRSNDCGGHQHLRYGQGITCEAADGLGAGGVPEGSYVLHGVQAGRLLLAAPGLEDAVHGCGSFRGPQGGHAHSPSSPPGVLQVSQLSTRLNAGS